MAEIAGGGCVGEAVESKAIWGVQATTANEIAVNIVKRTFAIFKATFPRSYL